MFNQFNNPYAYNPRLAQLSNNYNNQMAGFQQIQPIQQAPQLQTQIFMANNASDLESVQVMPNYLAIGLNLKAKEVYLKQMSNDGLTELNVYKLESATTEKNELKSIIEKIENLTNEIKGVKDEFSATLNTTSHARVITEKSDVFNVPTNDGRKKSTTTNANVV